MNWTLTKTMYVIALISALVSVWINHSRGYHAYSWQIACILWILTCFVLELRIDSLNKNK